MNAKSLLFRMLLRRVLKRTAVGALMAWGAFAWVTGRIAPGEGIARVYATITDKIGHKSRHTIAVAETQDVVATRAAAQVKVAGIDPNAKLVGALAKGAYSANDVLCLAHAVYYEARNAPHEAQVGVAQVALNRVATMPGQKSICRIVYLGLGRPMGCLFAQTCRHLGTIPDDEVKWRAAIELAQDVAAGKTSLPAYGQATHFNASALRPSWVSSVYKLNRVGQFTFYSTASAQKGDAVDAEVAPGTLSAQQNPETAARDENADLAARRKALNLPRSAAASRPSAERAARVERPARNRAEPARSPFGDTFN